MPTKLEKAHKELWKKILPRPISTEILKERLCAYLETKRVPLETKMDAGLGFIRSQYFARTQKWKQTNGNWERIFDYYIHYGIGLPKPAPFYLVVISDKEDVQVLEIRCMCN